MKNTLFLLFLCMTLLFSACPVPEQCQIPGGAYEFEIPVSLSPAKDTFNIGDTISIASIFPDQVYERKTDKWYILENFLFYPRLRIREISNSPAGQAGILQFDIIVDTLYDFSQFNYSDGAVGYVGEYSYDEETYSLEYKIIPKETGLFVFSHHILIASHGGDQEFDKKCPRIGVGSTVILNERADSNIELLNESPDEYYNTRILETPEQDFYKHGSYAFVVGE